MRLKVVGGVQQCLVTSELYIRRGRAKVGGMYHISCFGSKS